MLSTARLGLRTATVRSSRAHFPLPFSACSALGAYAYSMTRKSAKGVDKLPTVDSLPTNKTSTVKDITIETEEAVIPTASKRRRRSSSSPNATAVVVAAATAVATTEGVGLAAVASAQQQPDADSPAHKGKAKRTKNAKPEPGPYYNVSMRPPAHDGPVFKILSWNVAGLRALLKKDPGALSQLVSGESLDVLCIQEHKLQDKDIEKVWEQMQLQGWHAHWTCSTARLGYSGVAIFSRQRPSSVVTGIGVAEHDEEGRVVTAEFPDFYVLSAYVPNSGDGLKRLEYRVGNWDKQFAAYVRQLEARKPVIVTGDLNCAHKEIDIHEPKRNLRSAGFTQEERDSFSTHLVCDNFLVDSFRHLHPGVVAYTYFNYKFNCRANNKGWRLDYCLVSRSLITRTHESFLLPHVMGSDHVPVGITLRCE